MLEENDVWAAHGDAEGMTPRRAGDSQFSGPWRGQGCTLWWTQAPEGFHGWLFFSGDLCPFGGLGSLLARCGPTSLPRHLQAWMRL